MIDPDLVRDVLEVAQSGGAQFAELFAEERSSTVIRLDDGHVEEVVAGTDRGAGIRVFHGESQAYAYTNRLDAASLREAARAAASAGRGGAHGLDRRGADRRSARASRRADRRRGRPSRSQGRLAARGRRRGAGARPAVRQVLVAYLESLQRVLIATSEGRWAEEERPRVRLVAQVVAARDELLQTGFDGPAALQRPGVPRAAHPGVDRRAGRADGRGDAGSRPAPAGADAGGAGPRRRRHPVPRGVRPRPGGRPRAEGRLGVQGARRRDVRLAAGDRGGRRKGPVGWGTNAFDDEGTPTQRTVLFARANWSVCFTMSCGPRHDGLPSTGTAAAQSYASLPIPRMTNSAILPGESDPEDVVGDAARLYAKALGGGQVNPATGDFVFGVAEGYLIEDGRITTPVRGANLIGNGPQILAGSTPWPPTSRSATACAARRGRARPSRTGARRCASLR